MNQPDGQPAGGSSTGSVVAGGGDAPAPEDLTGRLKALAHPVRLRMVELIRERGEVCACEFEGHFDLTQPTLSHHLKALREAGLVTSRRDGVRSLHRIEPEAFRAVARWSGAVAGG